MRCVEGQKKAPNLMGLIIIMGIKFQFNQKMRLITNIAISRILIGSN